jgi:oligopeptide/dipeptide ABC transporter ATP-binding protein
MIAMAILCRPRLLIADEPTTALDVTLAEQVLRLLRSLQRERGFAVFFISHDLELVGDFCDHVAVLYAGRVVEQGPAAELLATPRHPYTRALLDSLPRNAAPGAELPTVGGSVPTGLEEVLGCAFAPRCPLAAPVCAETRPPLEQIAEERRVACFRWELAA